MQVKYANIILFFFLGMAFFPLQGENWEQEIRTMSWRKIHRELQNKTSLTKMEAFALARYHEEAPNGDSLKSAKLLYSIAIGSYPKDLGKTEISHILQQNLKLDSVLTRLTYRKLYKYLSKKKLLSYNEKISFLEKIPLEEDPVSINSYEDIIYLHLENGDYQPLLKKIFKLTQEEKGFLYTEKVQYAHGYALWKIGDEEKARAKLFQLAIKTTDQEIRKKVFSVSKKILGNKFPSDLNPEELGSILNFFSKSEQSKMLKDGIVDKKFAHKEFSSAKRIAYILSTKEPSSLLSFVLANKALFSSEEDTLCSLADNLINSKEFSKALAFINSTLKSSKLACKYKAYTRIYKKLQNKENYFYNLSKYLSIYPYDLIYQDQLIEFLAETKSHSIVYASSKYWETAMSEMPNLPVKGRLVYWYLRYLKYTNQTEKFQSVLSTYYSLCPGSYYTSVIAEEFYSELKQINPPENILSDKNSLIKYLSLRQYEDYGRVLADKDIKFAYYEEANALVQKLDQAKSKVESEPILQLATSYLKIGEYKYGMFLANEYVSKKKLNERETYEIYVGLGDASGYTYLSLFFTRTLMKLYLIPDDPLLLPSNINDRLYPRPHRNLVLKYSSEFGIEEDVVYAIMRQESFFRENAISIANARGLMKVMPSTGKYLAKGLKEGAYSLHDPEVSIRFGAKFLADLLKNNSNKLTWASIAYNGGPGNLRKWKRNHYKNDFNHFLEELPAKESRDYCRIIISNYNNYKILGKLAKFE
jgi:hypothetical protein